MRIPFSDLRLLHEEMRDELQQVFDRVLDSSAFVLGAEVAAFEREYAVYVGTEHCVGVNSGTAALHLTLAALGVGPGDEAITVPHTFMATAEAISATGARPVFVDIDERTYTMDAGLLEAAITPRTRAIIPVHLYGQMADMAEILRIGERHGIAVIEDACQAHGAMRDGRRAGSMGRAGCFSFFPGKNLGALGEAGAITTDDAELARKLRMWREHGSPKKYVHEFAGYNMRMAGLQGGFLRAKLRHLEAWTEQRRTAATDYDRLLAEAGFEPPAQLPGCRHVYHLYVIRVREREALRRALQEAGVETGVHYPTPLHLQKAYEHLGHGRGNFPVSERCADEALSLPMYPGIAAEAVDRVVAVLLEQSERMQFCVAEQGGGTYAGD